MILTEIATAEALSHKCGLCKAPPGAPCVNICNGLPLADREVHFYRIEPVTKGVTK